MTPTKSGLRWAAAILLNAAGNYFGLIDDKTAETLFVVLPIAAVVSLGAGNECRLWWRPSGEA
jgi:hypothetical protein